MRSTYKAVEVSVPGVLRVVERPISEPGAGQVRLRVEACGVCHSDVATVTGTYKGLTLPRVPGHEVVGRIEALGSGVSRWKIGQRVGVGPARRYGELRKPSDVGNNHGRRICGSNDR
jgi:alcohol dehydrogenase, propanol-preferring